jgi:four helix bundle protein
MKIERFEDIIAWQKAKELTVALYSAMKSNKDFGYKDQILRASVSIMNNIAEGFERRGDKELKHFLFISKGSCGELRSMLYLARELHYFNEQQYTEFTNLSLEISRLLSGFITSIK